jgi:hypothetical protein
MGDITMDKKQQSQKLDQSNPVKKNIPTRIEWNFYTLDWNGNQWTFSEWDIDNERSYPLSFDNNSHTMFVNEFRLKDSGLTQEQIIKMHPEELVIKGNWSACDYYEKCTGKIDGSIMLKDFDREYCGSYQHISSVCPLERMMFSLVGRADDKIVCTPDPEKGIVNHPTNIDDLIRRVIKPSFISHKIQSLSRISSLSGEAVLEFARNTHLGKESMVQNQWLSYTEDGDEGVGYLARVTSLILSYHCADKDQQLFKCDISEEMLGKLDDPSKAFSENKDPLGRRYEDVVYAAFTALKRLYLGPIAKRQLTEEIKQEVHDSDVKMKLLSLSPSEEYCVVLSVSNRVVPGIEDFFFHLDGSGKILNRNHCSYPDSQYQDNQPILCPICKTKFD